MSMTSQVGLTGDSIQTSEVSPSRRAWPRASGSVASNRVRPIPRRLVIPPEPVLGAVIHDRWSDHVSSALDRLVHSGGGGEPGREQQCLGSAFESGQKLLRVHDGGVLVSGVEVVTDQFVLGVAPERGRHVQGRHQRAGRRVYRVSGLRQHRGVRKLVAGAAFAPNLVPCFYHWSWSYASRGRGKIDPLLPDAPVGPVQTRRQEDPLGFFR